jgi:hypothetical protein
MEARSLSRSELAGRLPTLVPPQAQELEYARRRGEQALRDMPGSMLLERLFGDPAHGQQYFGLGMFQTATRRVRGSDPGEAPMTLECPISSDVELLFWLELARKMLRWEATPPSFFWSLAPPRLLVALGAPEAAVLRFWADPQLRSDRLWPTRTQNPQAISNLRRSLTALQCRVLAAPGNSAAAVLDALVG